MCLSRKQIADSKKKTVLTVFYCVLSHNLPFFSSSSADGTKVHSNKTGIPEPLWSPLSPVETITFLLLYLTITGVA